LITKMDYIQSQLDEKEWRCPGETCCWERWLLLQLWVQHHAGLMISKKFSLHQTKCQRPLIMLRLSH